MADRFFLQPYFMALQRPGLLPLAQPNWTVLTTTPPPGPFLARIAALHEPLAQAAAASLGDGDRPVAIAGDCLSSLGMLAGLQRAGVQPTLLWLDAHGDFNTLETTRSGFLGGMPLAMLTGRGDQTIVDALGVTPLPDTRILFSDGRDLDPGEAQLLQASALHWVADPAALLDQPLPAGPIYVHFDTDILRLADAPAMSYPAAGGPALATLRRLFSHLAASGQVVAVSVSCWNPDLPGADRSRKNAMALVAALLGGA